jgi:hypothetical protein
MYQFLEDILPQAEDVFLALEEATIRKECYFIAPEYWLPEKTGSAIASELSNTVISANPLSPPLLWHR